MKTRSLAVMTMVLMGAVVGGIALAQEKRAAIDERAGVIKEQTPKEGEPAAVGLPCIVGQKDIEASKSAGVRMGDSAGELKPDDVRWRVLAGSGLTYSNGLYYWYSNSNSSAFCETNFVWHSGRVYAYQYVGVCPHTGLRAYRIGVTD
jgi:hypothetical protein